MITMMMVQLKLALNSTTHIITNASETTTPQIAPATDKTFSVETPQKGTKKHYGRRSYSERRIVTSLEHAHNGKLDHK